MKTLLIANRGEIACRIIRSAHAQGIRVVAVYSDADVRALHVEMADQAVNIGFAPAADSYLDIDKIINAAISTGAEAIHPGYGFLSENAAFSDAVERAGLLFVGPPAAAIRAMGSKSAAKQIMLDAKVPTLPGYHGDDCTAPTLLKAAAEIGYPVLLKASAGGGGKGMRIVRSEAEFNTAFAATQREATKAFGDDHLLVEKFVERPRHVEVQVFFDKQGNGIYLGDRDCSLQRRHQKVVEEAPAPDINPKVRRAMGEAAVRSAAAINYVGAGTVEFLLAADQQFYFMEMNTRLQVEHPVTELVTGVDLVAWQLAIAAGEPLPLTQQDVEVTGHAVEARIYAEDTTNNFLPMTGQIEYLEFPRAPVRVDTGVRAGDQISVHYDPMIAKVICHGVDRARAIQQLTRGLRQCRIAPLITNTDFLLTLLEDPEFNAARLNTQFIDQQVDQLTQPPPADKIEAGAIACALFEAHSLRTDTNAAEKTTLPWSTGDGWRLNESPLLSSSWRSGGHDFVILGTLDSAEFTLTVNDHDVRGQVHLADGELSVEVQGAATRMTAVRTSQNIALFTDDGRINYERVQPDIGEGGSATDSGDLVAPMNGTVVSIQVGVDDPVAQGDSLIIVEAMKMEHAIKAPFTAQVVKLNCKVGELVEGGAILITVEAVDESD